jgi:hypothetical protein
LHVIFDPATGCDHAATRRRYSRIKDHQKPQ